MRGIKTAILRSIIIAATLVVPALAQTDEAYHLSFLLQGFPKNEENPTIIDAILKYDFSSQYPYYLVEKNKWNKSERLQVHFTSLPIDGYLYAIAMDKKGRIKIFQPIDLVNQNKTLNDFSLFFPAKDSFITSDVIDLSNACLSFWYSSQSSIEDFDIIARGIRYTTGSFLSRIIGQLATKLRLPSRDWHFSKDSCQLEITRRAIFGEQVNKIIPVCILFSSDKKGVRSRKYRQEKATEK